MGIANDVSGKVFGRLTVLEPLELRTPGGSILWKCFCECGNITNVTSSHLKQGSTQSCGCLGIERIKEANTKHGYWNHPLYNIWALIAYRCNNPKAHNYKDYGGRGITMCDRWRESVENFILDMGPRPSLDHSLDRKDNDGNYEPSNCRWATSKEQSNNRRDNRIIEYNGFSQTLSQWSDTLGIKYGVLLDRINKDGWSIERAFTEPIDEHNASAAETNRRPVMIENNYYESITEASYILQCPRTTIFNRINNDKWLDWVYV